MKSLFYHKCHKGKHYEHKDKSFCVFCVITDDTQKRKNLIFQPLTLVEIVANQTLTLLPYLLINKVIRLILSRPPFLLRFKKIKKIRLCKTSVIICIHKG